MIFKNIFYYSYYKMNCMCIVLLFMACAIKNVFSVSPDFALDFDNQNYEKTDIQIDCDKPLLLSPYIRAGQIEKAKKLAMVNLVEFKDIESYSGFLTVNETCSSQMFFWFFPTERKNSTDPIILWLQGGPGVSSLFGLVNEIGPFYIQNGTVLKRRKYHWSDKRNVLFIDNPVGTGFSFMKNISECYSENENDVRDNLYNALMQFYELFPALQKNELYLFGESYAGKYVTGVAYSIYENNEISQVKMNLKGLAIGNGLVDPITMIGKSSFLFNVGLVNDYDRNQLNILEDEIIELIKQESWLDATQKIAVFQEKVKTLTFNTNRYNFLESGNSKLKITYFNRKNIKCALHAGTSTYKTSNYDVRDHLLEDYAKSVKPWIEVLLEHYRVMFYNGQLDTVVGAVMTQTFIKTLNWSGAEEFKNRPQFAVKNDGVIAFGTEYGNLSEYRIRKAGHMAPINQPKAMHYLLDQFILNKKSI